MYSPTIVEGYTDPDTIRELFQEYTQTLMELDPAFAKYLKLQNFDHELEDLDAKYGKPQGYLLLARIKEEPVGCAALRRIDANRAELKRMYVRPDYRENKIGQRLLEAVLQQARKAGYRQILLDTLPCLKEALSLYQKAGFVPVEKYNDSPLPHSIFLSLDLQRNETN